MSFMSAQFKKYFSFAMCFGISAFVLSLAYGSVLMTIEDAVKSAVPGTQAVEKKVITLTEEQKSKIKSAARVSFPRQSGDDVTVFIVKSGNETLGYIFEDTVFGKWGPIHYILALNPKGEIINVIVLDYHERRGKPVSKSSFLNQFFGKTIHDPVKLRRDINGVTGATISSRAMTDGIRKLLYLFEEFFKV